MKKLLMLLVILCILVGGYGASDLALAKDATFKVTDVPGYWFDTGADIGVPVVPGLPVFSGSVPRKLICTRRYGEI